MTSRTDFEAFAASIGLYLDPQGDSYADEASKWAWVGWKAATERAAKVCDSEAEVWEAYAKNREAKLMRDMSKIIRERNE